MTKKVWIVILIGTFSLGIILLFASDIFFKLVNSKGVENSKTCDEIKPGITIDELYDILGDPINETKRNNDTWLYFNSHPIAAGLIRVRIDKKHNKVLILKCWEDSEPNWDLTKEQ